MTRLVGCSDNDLAGDINTRKSTSGTMFFLGSSLVSWQSLKHRVMAMSSYEAVYVAATFVATQVLWKLKIAGGMGF